MAFIYVITNNLNQKKYVGKTTTTIEQRWQQHIKDSKKDDISNRPLYAAFNKYGIENFSIQPLEECFIKDLNEKEIFWISKLNTYADGYNATFGGEGSVKYDYAELYDFWKEGHNCKEIQNHFGCAQTTIQRMFKEYKIPLEERVSHGIVRSLELNSTSNRGKKATPVAMIDKDTDKVLKTFSSRAEANRFLGKKSWDNAIGLVCRGKRFTAYGYKWAYI